MTTAVDLFAGFPAPDPLPRRPSLARRVRSVVGRSVGRVGDLFARWAEAKPGGRCRNCPQCWVKVQNRPERPAGDADECDECLAGRDCGPVERLTPGRQQLVARWWQGLVKRIRVNRFGKTRGVRIDDLESAGREALCDAACGFDGRRGYKFTTYAWPAVFNRMARTLAVETKHDVAAGRSEVLDRIGREPREGRHERVAAVLDTVRVAAGELAWAVLSAIAGLCRKKRATLAEVASEKGLPVQRVRELRDGAMGAGRQLQPAA